MHMPDEFPSLEVPPLVWAVSPALVPYEAAVAAMERRVRLISRGEAPETVWLTGHPPCYTAGTSAKPGDLLVPGRFPVFRTGRGGRFTYHGPGQRTVYLMFDVRRRFGGDVRAFATAIEVWLISALARLGVPAERQEGRVGVWVRRPGTAGRDGQGADKIAAVGLRIARGISYHGCSLNVAPNLGHYSGIVPCGIRDSGITSLAALGVSVSMADADRALLAAFEDMGGRTWPYPSPFRPPGEAGISFQAFPV